MNCTKCNSNNIVYEREAAGTLEESESRHVSKGRHKLIYTLFIGWWVGLLKFYLTFGLSLFFRKKKGKAKTNTKSVSKTLYRTVAVCQNCGNTWETESD